MLTFLKNADIFKSECQTLVCPVNTVGVMGNGLALAFKLKVPGLFRAYKEACESGEFKRRGLFLFTAEDGLRVLCFPTKRHYSMPSKIVWIDAVLKILAETYRAYGITSLAMPGIGCGKGTLNWRDDIRPLIEIHFEHHPLPITVFEPFE